MKRSKGNKEDESAGEQHRCDNASNECSASTSHADPRYYGQCETYRDFRKRKPLRIIGDWGEHVSSSGQKFYFNCQTQESYWKKPREWLETEFGPPQGADQSRLHSLGKSEHTVESAKAVRKPESQREHEDISSIINEIENDNDDEPKFIEISDDEIESLKNKAADPKAVCTSTQLDEKPSISSPNELPSDKQCCASTSHDEPIRKIGDWSEQVSSLGIIYYYNSKTKESLWAKPREWLELEFGLNGADQYQPYQSLLHSLVETEHTVERANNGDQIKYAESQKKDKEILLRSLNESVLSEISDDELDQFDKPGGISSPSELSGTRMPIIQSFDANKSGSPNFLDNPDLKALYKPNLIAYSETDKLKHLEKKVNKSSNATRLLDENTEKIAGDLKIARNILRAHEITQVRQDQRLMKIREKMLSLEESRSPNTFINEDENSAHNMFGLNRSRHFLILNKKRPNNGE